MIIDDLIDPEHWPTVVTQTININGRMSNPPC